MQVVFFEKLSSLQSSQEVKTNDNLKNCRKHCRADYLRRRFHEGPQRVSGTDSLPSEFKHVARQFIPRQFMERDIASSAQINVRTFYLQV